MSHPSLALGSLSARPTALAFVDADVADSAALLSKFQPGTEVHLLDSSQDAIDQITQVLAHRFNVSAVHIVSHGSDGALLLGGDSISDLSQYKADLKLWSQSLTADADILLYGCDVAGDTKGKAFVNSLSQLTGADVAASDDLTGQGGDWVLEYQTGTIETAAMADAAYQGTLANFFVNSTSDVVNPNDNVLTLREAITAANTQAGIDNIFFSVNGTITLTGGELGISSDVNIYGNGAPFLTISGNNASRVFNVSSGTVLLSGLTVANGRVTRDLGGGISNRGILTVQFCTFSNNSASFGGGGISNAGSLTVNSSTFSNNSASNFGGGIVNSGILTATGSYFLNNQAPDGGGIANRFRGTSTLISNVISRNRAANRGGGIFTDSGTVNLQLNNISSNTAGTGIDLFGTVISGNSPTNPLGFNLIGRGGGFSGILNGVNGDVILVP